MTGRKIGYARTATHSDAEMVEQTEALKAAGCVAIFTDEGQSGSSLKRPSLVAAMAFAQSGDNLYVCSMNRLSRSTSDLTQIMKKLKDLGITLRLAGQDS